MNFLFVFLGSGLLALSVVSAPQLGVRAQSFGGATRAESSSNDTIFFNPAGILKQRRLGPTFDYLLDSEANAHRLGASILDSQTSSWGLGLAYNGRFVNQNAQASSHLLYLAAAMPIASDIFSLGVSLNYAHDRGPGPDPYANFFNMDAGLLVNLPIGLGLALVADHLLNAKGHEKSLGVGLGAAYDLKVLLPSAPLSVSFDWLMDDVKNDDDVGHVLATGIQYVIVDIVPVRVGYTSDLSHNKKHLSLGSGFILGGFALDALFQQNLLVGKGRNFGVALRWAL